MGNRPDPELPGFWLELAPNIARRFSRPVYRFLQVEVAGGVLLAVAAVVALVWANSPFSASYDSLWNTSVTMGLGRWSLETNLVHLVNDGLMAIFFFVIGLDVKNEWLNGELRNRRAALLPILAAVGGMVVPALVYLAIAGSTAGQHGWGITMATDIAFAVGVMALLGRRVPTPLKVFLLTLAIVDDLGAILVIAVFYASNLNSGWLALAAVGLVLVAVLRALRVRWLSVYVVVGLAVWFATWQSGIHATIAGVALAFMTPAYAIRSPKGPGVLAESSRVQVNDSVADLRRASALVLDSMSPLARLSQALHPWAGFVIVPLFALANSGVPITTNLGADGPRVALGAGVGLLIGKCVGIAGSSWLVVRTRLAPLPTGVNWIQMTGIATLAGIGFTMSLLITDLAFVGKPGGALLADAAKVGVLAGSILAALVGSLLMIAGQWRVDHHQDSKPRVGSQPV